MSQGQSSTTTTTYDSRRDFCNNNSSGDRGGQVIVGFIEKYHNQEIGGPSCSIKPQFFRPPLVHKDLQKLRNLFKITDFKNGFFFLESVDDWEDTGKLVVHESCCCKVISEERDSEVIQEIKRNDEDHFVDEVYENQDLENALLNMKF